MENSREAPPTINGNNQNTRSEYHFAYYDRHPYRVVSFILVVIPWIVNGYINRGNFADLLFFLTLAAITVLSFLFLFVGFPRRRIVFDQDGMTSKGFWFYWRRMPRHCAWSELLQVRKAAVLAREGMTGALVEQNVLVFTRSSGKRYLLTINAYKKPCCVGIGHSLSIEDALERFVGPIKALSEAEKEGIPELKPYKQGTERTEDLDLGKEVGYVIYAALGVAISATFLIFSPARLPFLNNGLGGIPCWVFGLGAGIAACWYMRRCKRKLGILLAAALLLGGMVAYLLFVLFG